MKFLALDFETANYYRDSACAIGLAKVEDGRIIDQADYFIKPPSRWFVFTDLHGISYDDVRFSPRFDELFPEIRKYFEDTEFLVAHNASFDKSVLSAVCNRYGIVVPNKPFLCTMQLARRIYNIYPTKLPNVCDRLGIPFNNHHDAMADTIACAQIMLKIYRNPKFKISSYIKRGVNL